MIRRGTYTELDRVKNFDLLFPERWNMPGHSLVHGVAVGVSSRHTACGAAILPEHDNKLGNDTYVSCSACERGWWARMYAAGYDMWRISDIACRPYPSIHHGLILAGAVKPGTTAGDY